MLHLVLNVFFFNNLKFLFNTLCAILKSSNAPLQSIQLLLLA